jgi:hypothetical protein
MSDENNYVEVGSWVNGPKLDGPKLRVQTGRVAHKSCIDATIAGQAVDQPELDFLEVQAVPVKYCEKETAHGACNHVLVGERCEYWRDHVDEVSSL